MSVKKYYPKREGNECVAKSAMFNGSNQIPNTEKIVCRQGKFKSVNGQGYTVVQRSSDDMCCIYTAKLATGNGGQVVEPIHFIAAEGDRVS